MPRYFFHLRYGPGKRATDPEGQILPDPDAARAHAVVAARDLITHTRSDTVRDWFVCSFEIADETGATLLTVPFDEAVAPDSDPD